MEEFLVILAAAVAIIAVCLLGMAVGVIFRNKSFKSCGCSSITFRGEKINCPGCVDEPEEEKPVVEKAPRACCRVLEASRPPPPKRTPAPR